jgi:hypothetical protein
VVGEDYHALAVWMNGWEQTLDIERKISLGILDLAQLTEPWRIWHIYYRKLTIYKKSNEITAHTHCTRTSRNTEMLEILASLCNSLHLTKIIYSTKQFSVVKVIQIIRDNRG